MSLSRFVTFKESTPILTASPSVKKHTDKVNAFVPGEIYAKIDKRKKQKPRPKPFVEDDTITTNAIDFKVESKDENDTFLKSDKKWTHDVKKAIAKKNTKKKQESSDEESSEDESDIDTESISELGDETNDIEDTEDDVSDDLGASLEYVDDCIAGYESENEYFHPLFTKKEVEPKVKEYKIRVVACDDFDF